MLLRGGGVVRIMVGFVRVYVVMEADCRRLVGLIIRAAELKLFKKIESGKAKASPIKDFEKGKIRLQKMAENSLKRKSSLREKE